MVHESAGGGKRDGVCRLVCRRSELDRSSCEPRTSRDSGRGCGSWWPQRPGDRAALGQRGARRRSRGAGRQSGVAARGGRRGALPAAASRGAGRAGGAGPGRRWGLNAPLGSGPGGTGGAGAQARSGRGLITSAVPGGLGRPVPDEDRPWPVSTRRTTSAASTRPS